MSCRRHCCCSRLFSDVALIVVVVVVVLLSTAPMAESFAPHHSSSKTPTTTTRLFLKTGQGSQLVAAWNAAHCHEEDEEEQALNHHSGATSSSTSTMKRTTSNSASSSARAFVQKVFSLPSTMIRRHPHPDQEGFERAVHRVDKNDEQQHHDDVVYYPIVGFQFVKTTNQDEDGDDPNRHCLTKALPTSNCHAPSCSLPPSPRRQPVYGWYTAQSCPLGDLYSDDYCRDPTTSSPMANNNDKQQLAP